MQIPKDVRDCIDALENAGFAVYLVGGCVRDYHIRPSDITPNSQT